jgi:ApbE superfamily uncharacterized protein (UPF0280 family)
VKLKGKVKVKGTSESGKKKLQEFEFRIQQTHMKLKSDIYESFALARSAVIHNRGLLENYIEHHPEFLSTLEPLEIDLSAPEFIRNMMSAGITANVGPMAAVAGGLSEMATKAMMQINCKLALADNGGDISIKGEENVKVGVYGGSGSVAGTVGFSIRSDALPLGICTSAGVLGHSISFGEADAAVVFCRSAFLADAAATAVANHVKRLDPEGTIQNALEIAEDIDGVLGCMIFIGDTVGSTGWLPELIEIDDID